MISIDWSLLFTIINLVIFYILLRKFLFKPIDKIMKDRENEINQKFDEAENIKNEANELFTQYRNSLDGAAKEGKEIIKEARNTANEEYNRLVDEATKKADDILGKAKLSARQEYQNALEKAKNEITGLAQSAAEKISAENNSELYDAFIEQTERKS